MFNIGGCFWYKTNLVKYNILAFRGLNYNKKKRIFMQNYNKYSIKIDLLFCCRLKRNNCKYLKL